MADNDVAMPGQFDFTADQEQAMRQASPTFSDRYANAEPDLPVAPQNGQQVINSDFGAMNSPQAVMQREGQIQAMQVGNPPSAATRNTNAGAFAASLGQGQSSFNQRFSGDLAADMRPSTNVEDDTSKGIVQKGIEYVTKQPMAEVVEKVIHPFSYNNRFVQGKAPWTPPGQIIPSQ